MLNNFDKLNRVLCSRKKNNRVERIALQDIGIKLKSNVFETCKVPPPRSVECEHHTGRPSLGDTSIRGLSSIQLEHKTNFTMECQVYPTKPGRKPQPSFSTIKCATIYRVKGFDNITNEDLQVSLTSMSQNLFYVIGGRVRSIYRRTPFARTTRGIWSP